MRTVTIDHSDADTTVRRSAGATLLSPVRPTWLLEQMGRAVEWYRDNAHFSRADPEAKYAQALIERGTWSFPNLRGIVSTPTLAADGRIVDRPGFDAGTGLLLDMRPGSFPPIPPNPTKDQAFQALSALAAPLRGFPFRDDASKSVALSALLTALVRRSLRTAPLHGFDAPTAGSGKSLLAESTGILLLGVPPAAMSQGKSAEEDEKRLSTVLFAGDPIILIDNCERDISGDFLCSMLTQEMVQARILGLSERRILPSTALVLATGNNLTLAGDASRRAVVCGLDAKVERPDTRVFDFDFHAELLTRRAELVVAGLTVLRAYHVAGRPETLKPMGSFNDWAWVRGGLEADIGAHRTALLPASAEKPEARRIDFLLSHLRDRTPHEIAVFYNSATDEERLVLEAAAQSVGRIPTRKPDGSLAWAPLLPPETITESIVARASAKNPQGAKKLQELEELRAMHVTMAGIAEATVREVLEG